MIDALANLLLTIGLGISILSIIMLWTHLAGYHLGAGYAWFLAVIASAVAISKFSINRRHFRHKLERIRSDLFDAISRDWLFNAATLVIAGGIIASRFIAISDIEVPLWGDSYQHTLITSLIINNRGLFSSWEPYADLTSFTYHFGFHASAALVHWITGASAARSVLLTGQIFNIAAVLMLYPIGAYLGKNRWCGLLAVLVAGFLSPMPMEYTNWGRYTQLAGLVILPCAMMSTWKMLDCAQKWYTWALFSIISVSGLALTHYRLLIYYVVFYLILVVFFLGRSGWRVLTQRSLMLSIIPLLIVSPWLVKSFEQNTWTIYRNYLITPASSISDLAISLNEIGSAIDYQPLFLWILLGISATWLVFRKNREAIILLAWMFLLVISANPHWLGLPGTGVVTNFAIFTSAYLPVSLIIGIGSVEFVKLFPKRTVISHSRTIRYGLLASIMVIVLIFTQIRPKDIDPYRYGLVTARDLEAAQWIKLNTPPSARFLVNAFPTFGGYTWVGSDAGWWLPYLADRRTVLPPLNYGFESGNATESRMKVHQLLSQLLDPDIPRADLTRLMHENNIEYVYIGQKEGTVGYNGPYTLDPDSLAQNPDLSLVYNQEKVRIFRLIP